MPRYLSRRHQRLMDESEQALRDAVAAKWKRQSNIARHILSDAQSHSMWEAKHAELVRPVAEQTRRTPQILALRDIELRLIHRRALIDHIRRHELRGRDRQQMFDAYYGPRDLIDAIVTEHRQYMLAVSSSLSTRHLIDLMHDPSGKRLIRQYERLYEYYFELYGQVVRSRDAALANATRPLMREVRDQLHILREQIRKARPDHRYADFDRQALLARSGRQPILDYMVG